MQHTLKKSLLAFSIPVMFAGTACAATYEEGKHYKPVDQAKTIDGDKVEVQAGGIGKEFVIRAE